MSLQDINLIWLTALINQYLPLCIGAFAQLVFLLLPVNLKNWQADFLNVLTYVALQMFVAAIIFVGIPEFFELYHLEAFTSFYLIVLVGLAGVMRCVKMIPLESTSVESIVIQPQKVQNFSIFFDPKRLMMMLENSDELKNENPSTRFIKLREKLLRRKVEKIDQVGG